MGFDSTGRYKNIPSVVLAGRPNVGKSTLFNRLIRKRRAITDPTPGVTRDPIEVRTFIGGYPLRLIDTGGFKLEKEALEDLVVQRTLQTIRGADLIVLVIEGGELTSEDEEFIAYLRPFWDKMIVAVNKTEGGRRIPESWNLLSYGFKEMHFISAEHGDHIRELEEAIIRHLDFSHVELDDTIEERHIKIAILGKPNTGKSTLSNRLSGTEASLVSDIPGTTRDVIEGEFSYKNHRFTILDTAGIRKKKKIQENIEYYSVHRAIKTLEEVDIVFLVIDAQEGLTEQDKKIAALAHERGRGIIFVLNKWDTMPPIKNAFKATVDRFHFLFGQMSYAPIIPISAKEGTGIDKLLETSLRMYGQLHKTIETGTLNQALQRWLEEYPPPIGPKTHFKIRYAVQISTNPIKFAFFVSRPQAVSTAYQTYLQNKIRKDLGYTLIPVQTEIRPSRKEWSHRERK